MISNDDTQNHSDSPGNKAEGGKLLLGRARFNKEKEKLNPCIHWAKLNSSMSLETERACITFLLCTVTVRVEGARQRCRKY